MRDLYDECTTSFAYLHLCNHSCRQIVIRCVLERALIGILGQMQHNSETYRKEQQGTIKRQLADKYRTLANSWWTLADDWRTSVDN